MNETARDLSQRPRIVLGVTSTISLIFFRGQASYLRDAGFDVTVVSSPGERLQSLAALEGADAAPVSMEREIALRSDLKALIKLTVLLRRLRPTLTDFGTPKAGLLGTVASLMAGVPCRVYTLRGLRFETAGGLKRAVLYCAEWIACRGAHTVRCVSPSLRDRAVALKLVRKEKAIVVGQGTCNGVPIKDLKSAERQLEACLLRRQLGIPEGVPVLGFVGRLTRDKGIADLVAAYDRLQARIPNLRLLLIGEFETADAVPQAVRMRIDQDAKIVKTGFVPDTRAYYGLMNVLALPTYREGFPSVPLEANLSGVPVVTTTATGAIDSVVDGVTGLLVPVGDVEALASALEQLIGDPATAERMGMAGRERVLREFRHETIMKGLVNEYRKLIARLDPNRRITSQRGWRLLVKRCFDVGVALGALVLLSPVLLVVSTLVGLSMGSPILFRQQRPGKNGVPFTVLKFRTMRNDTAGGDTGLSDEARLTTVGRVLRATSLDELPQLWNVLCGHLSLVGPRPLLMQYLDRYTPEQKRRHDVLPGITGWAQVNGRNSLTWPEKFNLDLWYVDNWTLRLDLLIFCKTILRTVAGNGISQPGYATMPEFTGGQQSKDDARVVQS